MKVLILHVGMQKTNQIKLPNISNWILTAPANENNHGWRKFEKKKLVFIGRVEEIICGGNDVVGEGQSMRGRKSIGYGWLVP